MDATETYQMNPGYTSMLLLMGVVLSVSAQQLNLPKAAQAEILKQDIVEALSANRPADALNKFDQLRAVDPSIAPAMLYLEARAADAVGRPYRAIRALEYYFAKAASDDTSYAKAAQLMRAVQPKVKSSMGKELVADIQMVSIPGGSFQMGNDSGDSEGSADELPVHAVTIRPFRLGKYEVTVAQFRGFVLATNYQTEAERSGTCFALDLSTGRWSDLPGNSWRAPGIAQTDDHPVVCLSWNDVDVFINWLNQHTQRKFRLPSEAEWEYAARAKTRSKYPWGGNADQGCQFTNGADQTPWPAGSKHTWTTPIKCHDGHFATAAVGSYFANAFGLHDLIGNVWEWTQDCWNDTYIGAPSDGSAWLSGECSRRVVRGGAWLNNAANLRVSYRSGLVTADRGVNLGFRLAQDL
ncbi:MAG: hypothetical protein EPO25_11800 [Gammaproteobacteria bacterium]|nr:MAG: hypothetical protein EPO25_11800 [Gammaproteobacteria bacterium]